ncbi:MAG TPA: ATP-binding cassette domain-containing protein, partial [Streptosporangiaceae bacterium]
LSGGQRRRLGVAQAYLRHPGLLLLDEPTEGLDHHTARALLENLRSALPGTTIIAAIHDRTLDHLPVPADAAVRLAAGRVTGGLADSRGPESVAIVTRMMAAGHTAGAAGGMVPRPDTTFGTVNADVLERYVPGFQRRNFVDTMLNSDWPE